MPDEDEPSERQALYQKRMQQASLEMQKKDLLRRMLTDSAYGRMMNVRLSSPELYDKVVSSLAYVAQSGKPMERITDEQLYSLLGRMTEERGTKIEFRRK